MKPKPLDLEGIEEEAIKDYCEGIPIKDIEEFQLEPEQIKILLSILTKKIKQRIESAVQGLLEEIETIKDMYKRTINYATQERELRIRARIDELDTISRKIKKWFHDVVMEDE